MVACHRTVARFSRVEAAAPSTSTDQVEFTAAQDCWICLDATLRASLGAYEASESTWYMLEPLFQAASQRLFGLTDVGSLRQDEAEPRILADESVSAGVSGLDRAVRLAETKIHASN